ncbi:prolyl oligopeptidase family serine peptidase [Shewanella salipaludis]|uniref:Prolyl oligopeptidase family serine peptidase n=1 Tax=Shewanella salipaludis TaxID=2723052 RepID=A0A972JKR0_9GAMM|nr:prolyl oligopeptidase family serine peptidase [Shewanella salipaludis]NMH64642.1 prolyl oligopeptidase family serine peptidase [Shewanella salipaludis]
MKLLSSLSLLLLLTGLPVQAEDTSATQALTPNDIMHFESLATPVLAANGEVLAVEAKPDRGDSRTLVRQLTSDASYSVAGASAPQVSRDGRFVAMVKQPSLLALESSDAKAKKRLKSAMVLLDTHTGAERQFERVKSFAFNDTGSHLAIWFEADDDKPDAADKAAAESDPEKLAHKAVEGASKPAEPKVDKYDIGSRFALLNLGNATLSEFAHVTAYAMDKTGLHAAVVSNDIPGQQHQLTLIALADDKQTQVYQAKQRQLGALALSDNGQWLALTQGDAAQAPYGREYELLLFDLAKGHRASVPSSTAWTLNRYAKLRFSADNERLFFGRVPAVSQQPSRVKITREQDLYDETLITGLRDLKIWHGDDPLIKPNEAKRYKEELERTYLAVLHLESNSLVQLGDLQVPDVTYSEQRRFLLASSDLPYRKMITWAGFYRDFYLVDVNTGHKRLLLIQQSSEQAPSLSPNAKFVAYYRQGNVLLYDIAAATRRNLTQALGVGFADEDHDYPSPAPGYGFGPWLADDAGLLVYDKYDVWQFATAPNGSGNGVNLTAGKGRETGIQYRVKGLVEDQERPPVLAADAPLLLQGYNERTKGDGFYRARVGRAGVEPLMSGDYKLTVLERSKDAATLVYSRQRYDLFPDLYTSDYLTPQQAERQTELDAQRQRFNWGSAELVHWTNGDGKPLDGVLIKPSGYQPGHRYPVLVYYYRFMSDRLHAFPQMLINHRPNLAWYADNGYAIFLPDIRFEVGYPGQSSVQALTSGVQKLIELGIADPDAVGLHGHSWSGYQTAFAVTQTRMFKAAVAGAPVTNMTSAYSGIRHGTGLARQFQYETGQSRIGDSLFAASQKYIENSPVFYVERIETPLMIMFGDKDDAVPWEQGIELYLAMRRAGKEVVLLQYEDEPHHLKKYPNKLDYSIRMKQYFDHYLKGAKAPEWLTQGEAYREYKQED